MKKFSVSFILFCFIRLNQISGQNFISNGDFESHTDNSTFSIVNANGWSNVEGSVDLFTNDQSPSGICWPFINPFAGNCHAGMLVGGLSDLAPFQFREFMQTQTNQTLQANSEYYFELQTVRGNSGDPISNLGKLGVYFTTQTGLTNLYGNEWQEGDSPIGYGNSEIIQPQIEDSWPDFQYKSISGCFVPAQNSVYTVAIGNFRANEFSLDFCGDYLFIDNVNLELTNPTTPAPNVSFEVSATHYCSSDPMSAIITSWNDVQKYRWKLEKLSCFNGNVLNEITGDWAYTNPGTLDIDLFWPGGEGSCSCWRLTLQAYNKCKYSEVVRNFQIDCFTPVNLVGPADPFCEGSEITVSNTGTFLQENTYAWSNGAVGNSTTVIAALPLVLTYTQTTPGGCTQNYQYGLAPSLVFVNPNLPPVINSNQADYIILQAGATVNYQLLTADAANERVVLTFSGTLNGALWTINEGYHESATLTWHANYNDIGLHTFIITAYDNNLCGAITVTRNFTIKVVCGYCPANIYYENRTENSNPLPAFTKAGGSIVAGENVDPAQTNGPVSTGQAEVIFKAEIVVLDVGFTAGPGFQAIIDPQTCINDCEDCCDHFTQINVQEPLPNVFTPNGDGYNDNWNVVDYTNTECAYGAANRYQLSIYNQWGNLLYSKDVSFDHCCEMKSYYPGGPRSHSTIFWDGHKNQNNNHSSVNDGTYYYVLKIHSCFGSFKEFTGHMTVVGSNGMTMEDDGIFADANNPIKGDPFLIQQQIADSTDLIMDVDPPFAKIDALQSAFIYPNPAENSTNLIITNFNPADNPECFYNVFDMTGKWCIGGKINAYLTQIETQELAAGQYNLTISNKFQTPFKLALIIK